MPFRHCAGPDCCPVPVRSSDSVHQAGGVLQHVWPRYVNTSASVYQKSFTMTYVSMHSGLGLIGEQYTSGSLQLCLNDAGDKAVLKSCPHFKINPKGLSVVTACFVVLLSSDCYSFTLYTLINCLNPMLVAALYPGDGRFKILPPAKK